jgi:hypothetical protein
LPASKGPAVPVTIITESKISSAHMIGIAQNNSIYLRPYLLESVTHDRLPVALKTMRNIMLAMRPSRVFEPKPASLKILGP